jgi:3',5'-cyclic AMP phosphodiesterase CpdA
LRLLAISDLHVRAAQNRRFVQEIAGSADDWLVLGGDLGESPSDLELVLDTLAPRFARLVWVPGNHELWTVEKDGPRGVARYERLVAICRERGVLTPEDPYPIWPGEGPKLAIVPLFLLYDYSFRPPEVAAEDAIAWAAAAKTICTDEFVLHPDPYPSRAAWCEARCDDAERRLAALPDDVETILINHFPLRAELARLPRAPRFSLWCGTTRTHDWHARFRARAVVYGHLHIRHRRVIDGVPFHEVSLGYPRQWSRERASSYVHTVLER